jgi:phasin family protein
MYQAPEQFMQLGKSSIEAALSVANITLQGAERMVGLQLKTAKEALDESIRNARALSDVRNIQDLIALQSTQAQPGIEKALAYSRSLYEVASETQSQINKLLEARMAKVSGDFVAAVDQAVKNAPAGSESALAAFKSAVAAASTAYETLSKVARDATDAAVSNAATQAAKTSPKKRSH